MDNRREVDARGLACPQPVVETRKALEELETREVTVLVDSITSRDNVSRYARSIGCQVEWMPGYGEEYRIVIRRPGVSADRVPDVPRQCPAPPGTGTVVYVGCDQMGRGSSELGSRLMGGFLRTWIDIEPRPWRMLFINGGVHLTTDGSEVLEALQLLEEKGIEILSCGTCLEYFNLTGKLRVGRVTNMYEIIETLNQASRVISPH